LKCEVASGGSPAEGQSGDWRSQGIAPNKPNRSRYPTIPVCHHSGVSGPGAIMRNKPNSARREYKPSPLGQGGYERDNVKRTRENKANSRGRDGAWGARDGDGCPNKANWSPWMGGAWYAPYGLFQYVIIPGLSARGQLCETNPNGRETNEGQVPWGKEVMNDATQDGLGKTKPIGRSFKFEV
jgi:hypothetical protein